jgi:radial spoke head protein 9
MNILNNLQEAFEYISLFNGVTLSLEERLKLEISLNELKLNIKSEEIFFWGKILGVDKDYYIAMAIFYKNQKKFPKKLFYFCTSNSFVFSLLPEILDYHIEHAFKSNTYFIGNPETILKKFNNEEIEIDINENEFESIYKKSNLKKNFTEADRLSYVVRHIEFDCSIIPVGSYKMIPLGEIRVNDNFRGLNENELTDLKNYLHFRPALTKEKVDLINRGEAVLEFNFLDDLSQDNKKSKENMYFICNYLLYLFRLLVIDY